MAWRKRAAVLAATGLILIASGAGAGSFESYLQDETVPSLKERYAGKIEIGVPAAEAINGDAQVAELITEQCNLLDCSEQTGAGALLDRGGSKKSKDPDHAKIRTGSAKKALDFASDKGMNAHAATVVIPSAIPRWFFAEGFATAENASLVSRSIMSERMRNAIRDEMDKLNEEYPGVITGWTVVRGGGKEETDLFRDVIGDDYIRIAFETARQSAGDGQKLFYETAGIPDEAERSMILDLHADGLADGVILACSFEADETELQELEKTLQVFADAGVEIRLGGLEIADTDRTAFGQMLLASLYKEVFTLAENTEGPGGYAVSGITLPALRDRADRKEKGTPPRLFNTNGHCTAAFFGALQDEDIPLPGDDQAAMEAIDRLDLEAFIKKEEDPVIVYKKANEHNPVMVQRFGADPWAMEYDGRIYLYMTGDDPAVTGGEKPKTNDYSNIVTIRVLSSDDLVNWTDHGSVRAAGSTGAAKWAGNSWAPCAAWKTIDGQDKFFLYFANSGGGIGVLTADSPTGPFTDPLGKALVSRNTPTCDSVTWLFDPAVLVDEDGSAYLYFGGGVPEGRAADPGTARVAKLGSDMISLDGDPVGFNPPWLFEDSGINRIGDTYLYSYCSNFNVPGSGSSQGFYSGEIVYMTSDSPMGPFVYKGRILQNPGTLFGVGGNNHHCMFSFNGEWYITYHAATLDKKMGWNAGYRSVFIDRLGLDENGLPVLSKGTSAGVEQLHGFDPYEAVPGATAVTMAGATTELAYAEDRKAGTGRMAVVSTVSGGWTAVTGVEFGNDGAEAVRLCVRAEVPSRIEIVTDDPEAAALVTIEVAAVTEDTEVHAELPVRLNGTHDLYFRFTESGVSLLEWQFE